MSEISFNLDPLVEGKSPKETTVVVAMSGGVDSSVVAALLHKLGYNVIGATLQLYNASSQGKSCCGSVDVYDAKRVASLIGFPHYVLNYEAVFKKEVIDDFINSYKKGETPVPCVRCNQTVKFRDMLKAARAIGGDVIATGHYVRRIERDGEQQLLIGVDASKDQSYFLFSVTLDQLNFIRFPLGSLTKDDVRKMARSLNLEVANKPDSQDICFVPNSYRETLRKMDPLSMKSGNIVHVDGRILGEHCGIANFTVGQRKGIGISSPYPLYVIDLDASKNQVIVGPQSYLMKTTLLLKDLNWLSKEEIPEEGLAVSARLRSFGNSVGARIFRKGDCHSIILDRGCIISPGQACVLYRGERLLGGGWILKPGNNETPAIQKFGTSLTASV